MECPEPRPCRAVDGAHIRVSKTNRLAGSPAAAQPARRRGPHILSTILFLVAVGFAIGAVYLYWQEQQDDSNTPTPPPAASGQYTLVQVKSALDGAGMTTDFGRNTGHADQIGSSIPGQTLTANGNDVVVFIFSGTDGVPDSSVEMAEQAFAGMDASTIEVTRPSGEQIGGGEEAHIVQSSNVIAVMFGGSEEDVEQFESGIASLT
jgi:hypothetical protein